MLDSLEYGFDVEVVGAEGVDVPESGEAMWARCWQRTSLPLRVRVSQALTPHGGGVPGGVESFIGHRPTQGEKRGSPVERQRNQATRGRYRYFGPCRDQAGRRTHPGMAHPPPASKESTTNATPP